jgi:methanogenic corrinoid protein MtbC1
MNATSSNRTRVDLAALSADYLRALLNADQRTANQMILDTVTQGVPIKDIYLQVFQPSQYEVGRLWQTNQISVAQEHYCSAATQMVMSQLYPLIFSTERKGRKLIATCVSGELHEIGIRMVTDFFEMEGWDTYYVGANTPVKSVLKSIDEHQADLLCISATMYFNTEKVSELIADIRASEIGKDIAILVGGYPFLNIPDLWKKVGANGFGRNAQEALDISKKLIQ